MTPDTNYTYIFEPTSAGYSPNSINVKTDKAPIKQWDVGTGITITGEITSDVTPQTSIEGEQILFVQPGQEVNLAMPTGNDAASDSDHWKLGTAEDTDPDTLTYKWEEKSLGEAGGLSTPTESTTKWTVPAMVGDYDSMPVTLKCTVDDTPKALGAGEGGTRDDDKQEKSLDFVIVRTKWLVDPPIGHHPQLDANGHFDPKNITWVEDGKIIEPAPQDAPYQMLAGASMRFKVGEAHDWDGWLKSRLSDGYTEDTPLTYRWTAEKGQFLKTDAQGNLVTDAQGHTIEDDNPAGLFATWVAPTHLDADQEDVEVKCTIDDAEGARVGALEAGTRDDEALERTVNVKVMQMQVTFEDQLARACAGGVAVDGVHDFTITGTAKLADGTAPPEGTELKLSFENNKGEDKRATFIPNTQKGQTLLPNTNGEEMTVVTDADGQFPVQVLSSDIISSDIKIKVKRVSNDGQETEAGEKECNFAKADNIRRFGIKDSVEEEDSGWLFNQGVSLSGVGVVTPVKVYLKFRKNPDDAIFPIDANYFWVNGNPQPTLDANGDGEISDEERASGTVRRPLNDDGNWGNVVNHTLHIKVAEVHRADGVSVSPDSFGDYVTLLNNQGQPADIVVAVTDGNGGASAQIKSRELISLVEEVVLEAEDQNQISP